LDNYSFDRHSLKYLQRTEEEEQNIINTIQPTDAEDLKFLRKEIENRKIITKWTPYPATETKKKVKKITPFFNTVGICLQNLTHKGFVCTASFISFEGI